MTVIACAELRDETSQSIIVNSLFMDYTIAVRVLMIMNDTVSEFV